MEYSTEHTLEKLPYLVLIIFLEFREYSRQHNDSISSIHIALYFDLY